MNISLFCYRADIVSVYDGDTCTVNIDLGLSIWKYKEKLRLNIINTPELRGEEREKGLIARDYLRSLLEGRQVLLQSIFDKKGKFGRYLAELWILNNTGRWENVNDLMIKNGQAVYYQNKVKAVSFDVNEVA